MPEYANSAVNMIAEERQRQIEEEGFLPENDDAYEHDELAKAAACYALPQVCRKFNYPPALWPWQKQWWKPSFQLGDRSDNKKRIRELVKSGALIVAEIERLQRNKPKHYGSHTSGSDDLLEGE